MYEITESEELVSGGADQCAYAGAVGGALGAAIGGTVGSAVGGVSAIGACRFVVAVMTDSSSFGNDGSIGYAGA